MPVVHVFGAGPGEGAWRMAAGGLEEKTRLLNTLVTSEPRGTNFRFV